MVIGTPEEILQYKKLVEKDKSTSINAPKIESKSTEDWNKLNNQINEWMKNLTNDGKFDK